jgi:hypothetical protein
MKRLLILLALLLCGPAFADIALEGTPAQNTSGDSYTAESGANRSVIWVVGARLTASDSVHLTAATFGAESMNVRASSSSTVASNVNTGSALADVMQASIPGGSNVLTATHDAGGTLAVSGIPFTLTGVDQSGPVDFSTNGSNDSSAEVLSIDVVEGGISIIAVTAQGSVTGTPAGYTSLLDNISVGGGTAEMSVAYKLITADGTEAPVWPTGAAQWRTIGVSYGPAAASTATQRRRQMMQY